MLEGFNVLKLFALVVSPSSFGGTFEARQTPRFFYARVVPEPIPSALLAFGVRAEPGPTPANALEPCINGEVSKSGIFPSQAMEDAFTSYLGWTRDERLSRLVVFESVIDGAVEPGRVLPTREMAQQLDAYMRWVQESGISPFYAFTASVQD